MTIEKGQKIKVWINDHKTGRGNIKLYSTTVGNRLEDGTFINALVPISFSNSVDKSQLFNGCDVELEHAWLTAQAKSNDHPTLRLFINKLKVISA